VYFELENHSHFNCSEEKKSPAKINKTQLKPQKAARGKKG